MALGGRPKGRTASCGGRRMCGRRLRGGGGGDWPPRLSERSPAACDATRVVFDDEDCLPCRRRGLTAAVGERPAGGKGQACKAYNGKSCRITVPHQ